MEKIIRVTREVEEIEDILCDICGKSCKDNSSNLYEFLTLHASWGYGSHRDCTTWDGEICESCSDKIKLFIESLGGRLKIIDGGE